MTQTSARDRSEPAAAVSRRIAAHQSFRLGDGSIAGCGVAVVGRVVAGIAGRTAGTAD